MKSDILFTIVFFIMMFACLAGLMWFMDKNHQDEKLKQQKQSEKAAQIRRNCTLTTQNFANNQAHYRCHDGMTYILQGLPEKDKP